MSVSNLTITNVNQTFTDIDLNFEPNPITGDINEVIDAAAVSQSLVTLVMMNPYEIPYHPEISSQANGMLFEQDTPFTQATIQKTIVDVITKFEPRVQLYQVIVTPSTTLDGYQVTIAYTIIGSGQNYSVSVLLQRAQ